MTESQLDLFSKEAIDVLNDKVEKTRNTSDAVRKGLFARHNRIEKLCHQLEQKYEEQQKEISLLKQLLICKSEEKVYDLREICI